MLFYWCSLGRAIRNDGDGERNVLHLISARGEHFSEDIILSRGWKRIKESEEWVAMIFKHILLFYIGFFLKSLNVVLLISLTFNLSTCLSVCLFVCLPVSSFICSSWGFIVFPLLVISSRGVTHRELLGSKVRSSSVAVEIGVESGFSKQFTA